MTTARAAATLDVTTDHVTKLLREGRLSGRLALRWSPRIVGKGRNARAVRQRILAWAVDGYSVRAYRRAQRERNA